MSAPATRGDLVGQVIGGRFTLLQWLGSSRGIDSYLTDYGDPSQKAVIKLVPADSADAEVRMSAWIAAANLSHPNLIKVFTSGRGELETSQILYVVSEYADEVLSEIIPDRALTPQETREMLGPAIDALAYLHSKGLVHGRLKPSNIVAVGDRLKLSTDGLSLSGSIGKPSIERTIYDAPETIQGRIGTAADIWSLGVTLIEILTQRPPDFSGATAAEPAVPDTVPEPFASIARECLRNDPGRRCTLDQIRTRLDPAATPPPAKKKAVQQVADRAAKSARPAKSAKPAEPATPAKPVEVTKPAAPSESVSAPSPVKPVAASKPASTPLPAKPTAPAEPALFAASAEPASHNWRVWAVLAAVVVVIVSIVVWQARSHDQSPAPAAQDQSAPAASSSEASTPSATPSQPPSSAQAPAEAPAETPSSSVPAPEAGAPPAAAAPSAPAQSSQPPQTASPAASRASAGATVKGAPVQQVQPNVLPKAMHTIYGTVKNAVWVTVDEKGSVTAADIDSTGPSQYFANKSLEAARKWTFQPALVAGQPVESTWVLHFQYKQSGVTITPIETVP